MSAAVAILGFPKDWCSFSVGGKLSSFSSICILSLVATLAYIAGARSPGQSCDTEVVQSGYLVDFTTFNTRCAESVSQEQVREILHEQEFNGSSPFEGFPPPDLEPHLKPQWIKGWGSETPVFQRLIEETRPALIMEFGTFLGASAIHMANISRQLGLNPLILCVDDYRGWMDHSHKVMKVIQKVNGHSLLLYQFMQNVVATGFADMILPIPYNVEHAGVFFCQQGIKADLIAVDAGHTFHSAWIDINIAYSLLSPNGVLFGHDWKKSDVRRAAEIFASLHGAQVVRDGQHWILRPNKV